ncbi:two-component system sensor histidine kinase YesM [Paenibacillus phyllosphaerae]|uniref:histidine kinase n=1 Tax=Paenibacillus phyllosphaerae TaxID=274593 RepID=A0A7W5ATD0_9BACL|nr:sensor histidine kinase [Paenibacillus phyllosphaerae]MBB3108189.1 two-component system sensor histidine kinase YesM [Paenibacillus phyllosphaerae]
MRLINRYLADRSIRFKLLLYFVLIITGSVLAISLIGSSMYKRSIEQQANKQTLQSMNLVKNHVQVYLDEMDNIAFYVSRSREVLEFLRLTEGQGARQAELKQQLIYLQEGFVKAHAEIAGMVIVSASGQHAALHLETITRDPLTMEGWYQSAIDHPDAMQMFSHPIGRNIRIPANISADHILSFAKAIVDPTTGEPLGVVLIDMQLGLIQNIVETGAFGKSGFVFIMDENGGVVYSPVNPIVYRIWGGEMEGSTGSGVQTIRGQPYQILYNTFVDSGWRVVGVFPLNESLEVVTNIQRFTILIAMITLLTALIASWYLTNSIVRPLSKLRSLMKKVEEGELALRFPSKSKDEIGQLGQSFNNMVAEIDNLIELVYKEQQAKREAELRALQSQIKPHFLYNTMDTIQWMAIDRGADDIVEIVAALTLLFRNSLSKGQEIIPLRNEIQHVESYLTIQMARYEDKLRCEIDIPKELHDYYVVKIMLQPLVENAIYHGIKPKSGPGMIRIRGEAHADYMVLVVEDDGAGIPPEQVARMNDTLSRGKKSPEDNGYGLYNVHERIQLIHGPAFGLTVASELGSGTKVMLRLPLLQSQHMGD